MPSLTVTRMVEAPDWLAAGVTVTVRLAPEPPKTTLATGTRAVSDEVAGSVRLPAGVSASPTVKATAPVGVSSLMVWSAMLEMVGASLTAVTVSDELVEGAGCAVADGDADGGRCPTGWGRG